MTQTIRREPRPETPVNECSHCQGPVLIRRQSKTGRHYCTKTECQAAKQRFYYRMRADTGFKSAAAAERERAELARRSAEARDLLFVDVIRTLTREDRVVCPDCGRTDALPGYVHPSMRDGSACRELREKPLPSGAGDRIVAAIWGS